MAVQRLSPKGMLHPVPYDHVAIGTGSRQVLMAGQTGRPADGSPIADDLATQISDALRSIARGLAGAGGTFADVVRLTFYVPNWNPSMIEPFEKGVSQVVDELGIPTPWPPFTLVGVQALWEPDILVEIEVNATLD